MTADRVEAGFWAAWLRNRNVEGGNAEDGAVAVAGGYALCAAGTFLQYGIGVGSTRPLRHDDLAVVESFYRRRRLPPRLELGGAVLSRDAATIAAAGYRQDGVRQAVLETPVAPLDLPDGVAVRETRNRAAWIGLVVRAFADTVPQHDGPRLRRATEACADAAHALFVAEVDGVDAGGAAVAIAGDSAFLYSGGVLPEFRRRGAHRALLAARVRFGHARGASRALLKTAPGSPAERGAMRLGFTRTDLRIRVIADD